MEPHGSQRTYAAGAPLEQARAAIILVHGRGADPRDMLGLFKALDRPDFACLAPAAAGNTWYPFSFMADRGQNQPGIDSGLSTIGKLVELAAGHGIEASRVVIGGFSQGACLSSEFCVRHPRRYGGLLAFSGGLIGAAGTTWDDVQADLDGMPAFLGCSDIDPHIPSERVVETEEVLGRLGARVTRKFYGGMGHTINDDELVEARRILDEVLA